MSSVFLCQNHNYLSSQNMNCDRILIPNLFSVYSCLRSFSTLLYVSPFQLEDSVAAVKCTPSSLCDCVHVSILQILRTRSYCISNEGSQSAASDCLRSLNWDLVGLITCPVFMWNIY